MPIKGNSFLSAFSFLFRKLSDRPPAVKKGRAGAISLIYLISLIAFPRSMFCLLYAYIFKAAGVTTSLYGCYHIAIKVLPHRYVVFLGFCVLGAGIAVLTGNISTPSSPSVFSL